MSNVDIETEKPKVAWLAGAGEGPAEDDGRSEGPPGGPAGGEGGVTKPLTAVTELLLAGLHHVVLTLPRLRLVLGGAAPGQHQLTSTREIL